MCHLPCVAVGICGEVHSLEQTPKSEFWADVYSLWVSVETLSGYGSLGEPIAGTILVLRHMLYPLGDCWSRSPALDVGCWGIATYSQARQLFRSNAAISTLFR